MSKIKTIIIFIFGCFFSLIIGVTAESIININKINYKNDKVSSQNLSDLFSEAKSKFSSSGCSSGFYKVNETDNAYECVPYVESCPNCYFMMYTDESYPTHDSTPHHMPVYYDYTAVVKMYNSMNLKVLKGAYLTYINSGVYHIDDVYLCIINNDKIVCLEPDESSYYDRNIELIESIGPWNKTISDDGNTITYNGDIKVTIDKTGYITAQDDNFSCNSSVEYYISCLRK